MDDGVSRALVEALSSVTLTPADGATAALATAYAASIDAGADLSKLGPPFLACLTQLGMTPAARAALLRKGSVDEPATSALDELRQRRQRPA